MLPEHLADQDQRFSRAFQVIETGVAQKAFPGASIAITHCGELVASKGIGRFTYEQNSPSVSPETIYDLASVTKVIATTAACMLLYERGVFQLEQPVVEILPEFSGHDPRRKAITFRMLLAHSSGLPGYVRLFERTRTRKELIQEAMRLPLTAAPGTRHEYSDIGFILLGVALERLTKQSLDRFCQHELFSWLGLEHTAFLPPLEWKPRIPPTVDDRTLRRRIVQGEVHDENAWVMDGVAGHAGCFATALDVAVFADCLLYCKRQMGQSKTVALFTRRESSPPGASHALGWDTPSPPSQSGKYFSPSSYGHLGYTGTSLWVDPERQLAVTLLTNRIWPDCSSQKIKQIRPAFHDAVVEALQ